MPGLSLARSLPFQHKEDERAAPLAGDILLETGGTDTITLEDSSGHVLLEG